MHFTLSIEPIATQISRTMMNRQGCKIIIALGIVAVCLFESNVFNNKTAIPASHKSSAWKKQLNSLWETKTIELPNKPSSRTGFSSRNVEQFYNWIAYQEVLQHNISKIGHVNILFYGDSITESLVGTSYGRLCTTNRERCRYIPEV